MAVLYTRFIVLILIVSSIVSYVSPEDITEEKFRCADFLQFCYCSGEEGVVGLRVDCDGVVFPGDFPRFPSQQNIASFSWTNTETQNIPPQAFLPLANSLLHIDLRNKNLRRISERGFQGLNSLIYLDLSHNALGDTLNPIFSPTEISKLPRLKILKLSSNGIRKIEGGLLQGTISLQELDLDSNELNQIPSLQSRINGPQHLRKINLAYNRIQELGRDDFEGLSSLLHLNLTGNNIGKIDSGVFIPLKNLKNLILSQNHLLRINSDAFNGLESLEELDLSGNFLREFPTLSLQHLYRLRILSASSNLIHVLRKESFDGLQGLHELSLSRNRLSQIPGNTFSKLKHLKSLDLSVNQMRTIQRDLFEGLQLTKLDLSDNLLLLFPSSALQPLRSLSQLHLAFNRISVIQEIPNKNITFLNLQNNLLRILPSSVIGNLSQLQELHLEGNQLESLQEISLPSTISQLHISRNNISILSRFNLPNLRVLTAEYNQIQGILPHNFIFSPQLEELKLQHNQIKDISINAFSQLDSLTSLDLSFNSLSSTSLILQLPSLTYLNLSSNSISSITTLDLPSLESLDLSYNQINAIHEPPANSEFLRKVFLQGNRIHSWRGLLGNYTLLSSLDLSSNQIRYLFPYSLQNYSSLSNLNLFGNELTFFPPETLKMAQELTHLDLSKNRLIHVHELSFSSSPYLRTLQWHGNGLETLPLTPFKNNSQLQSLDLSSNKIEELDVNFLEGILSLELNLGQNYISHLPTSLFHRLKIQKLRKLDLSNNHLSSLPQALQSQLFNIRFLNLSQNQVTQIPPHSNTLTNIHTLDLSHNPLSPPSVQNIMNEPKTTRILILKNTSISSTPQLETPFLRTLDLSFNRIQELPDFVFNKTTLLENLILSNNPLVSPPSSLPNSISTLDLSNSKISVLSGHPFPSSINKLVLNDLESLTRIEKSSLTLSQLKTLEIANTPKLGYIDIRGILLNLHFLEYIDVELKDHELIDQFHSILSPRINFMGISGRSLTSISSGALAGLTAPKIRIQIANTSISALPPILVPLPTSSEIHLHLTNNPVSNISPPLLSQRILITGINPLCNCNTIPLLQYLRKTDPEAKCSDPPSLRGKAITSPGLDAVLCSIATSTLKTYPLPTSSETPPTFPTLKPEDDDIIWSLPPLVSKTTSTPSPSIKKKEKSMLDTNAMDNLILGIVGGTIGLLLIFILSLICCLKRKPKDNSNSIAVLDPKCTCPPPQTLRMHQHPLHHPIFNQQIHNSIPYFYEYDNRR